MATNTERDEKLNLNTQPVATDTSTPSIFDNVPFAPITRADYMAGRATHRQYYADVVKTAGISYHVEDALVERAAESTDPHYNDIRLRTWDCEAAFKRSFLSRAFKVHGDFYTDAGGVCAIKEAVRQAVERRLASKEVL